MKKILLLMALVSGMVVRCSGVTTTGSSYVFYYSGGNTTYNCTAYWDDGTNGSFTITNNSNVVINITRLRAAYCTRILSWNDTYNFGIVSNSNPSVSLSSGGGSVTLGKACLFKSASGSPLAASTLSQVVISKGTGSAKRYATYLAPTNGSFVSWTITQTYVETPGNWNTFPPS